jgi:hypothetical protein
MSDVWGYLATLALGIGAGEWHGRWRRNRDQPNRDSRDRPGQRYLDTITVHCESLDHQPSPAPIASIARFTAQRDVRVMREHGWGGTTDGRINTCYLHSHGQDLKVLHLVCHTPNCGERAAIPADRIIAEFSRLAGHGWRNTDDDDLLCPYCTGFRHRHRW